MLESPAYEVNKAEFQRWLNQKDGEWPFCDKPFHHTEISGNEMEIILSHH